MLIQIRNSQFKCSMQKIHVILLSNLKIAFLQALFEIQNYITKENFTRVINLKNAVINRNFLIERG